jgi:lysyl-tRNA synthetase, class II
MTSESAVSRARSLPGPTGATRAPGLIAAAAAIFGLLGLVAATTGPLGGVIGGLQAALVPEGAARGVIRGLIVGLSLGLLLSARGLARRQHRAWTAAVTMTALATGLFLLRDFDVPATFLAAAFLACLWYWRREFLAAASVRRPVRTLAAGAVALSVVFAGGLLVQIWHSSHLQAPWSWSEIASLAGWGMIGQDAAVPSTDFSRELVATMTVATAFILAYLAWALLRPPRGRTSSSRWEWREAKRLVTSAGDDSLAYFALRRDKRYYFNDDHSAFLAYRAVNGVALVSGDPVGDPGRIPGLLEDFSRFCRLQAWRVAAIGVGEKTRPLWDEAGLKTFYVGDEAVVRPETFTLEGRAVRKLRQSVNRLDRLGFTVEMVRAGELDDETRRRVLAVSEIWRGGQPERGFSMALDDVGSTELEDTLFVLGRGPDGRVAGFLHFVPVPASGGLSLSAMRRLPDTPNGFNEFLVSSLLFWAREREIDRVSLNFAVFGGVLRDEGSGAAGRVSRGALRYADRFFQVERLLDFNRKFGPEWIPRYLAVESVADLPGVGLVVLHLESLLPGSKGPAAPEPDAPADAAEQPDSTGAVAGVD